MASMAKNAHRLARTRSDEALAPIEAAADREGHGTLYRVAKMLGMTALGASALEGAASFDWNGLTKTMRGTDVQATLGNDQTARRMRPDMTGQTTRRMPETIGKPSLAMELAR